MRRTIALLTTIALTLLVATSVAMAAVISCPTPKNPPGSPPGTCRGTSSADRMTGTAGTFRNAPGENFHGDIILSFRGDDTLRALGANDSLNGGQGNDKLDGGTGPDTYVFQSGWGLDTITADASGNDTLDFSKLSQSGVVVDLVASPPPHSEAKSSSTSTLNLRSTVLIENIIGSAHKDIFFGSNGDNSLRGAEDNDSLFGRDGKDTLDGGAGRDYFYGGSGNDTIRAADGFAGGADGGISCGDGVDVVYYDQFRDPPLPRDCEIKRASL